MSSDVIEGEPSHVEAIPIFSPSMPTTNISFEPIFEPILEPDDSLYAHFPESHDDPRNPKHRNHEGSKDNQEKQQQRLDHSCIVASKEWMDKAEPLRI